MMSPRWKLSCEESWAEKSNWAWAKQAWEACVGRRWLVGNFQEAPTREVIGFRWGRAELNLNLLLALDPDRWPPNTMSPQLPVPECLQRRDCVCTEPRDYVCTEPQDCLVPGVVALHRALGDHVAHSCSQLSGLGSCPIYTPR